jgi:hypothetical protein
MKMPILDYGPILTPGGQYRAQIAVRAVMGWPDPADREHTRRYVATLMSVHIAALKAQSSTLPDPITAEGWEATILAIEQHEAFLASLDLLGDWFEEAGGHASVSMAPGFRSFQKEFGERTGDWFAAGMVLALVRRMATHHADLPGGASVNKAVYILENVRLPSIPRNRHHLRKAWSTYKPVSHFCAALFDWFIIALSETTSPQSAADMLEKGLNEDFMSFLSEAEAYLEFGLTYQPQRTRPMTLLNEAETWTLPEHRPWMKSYNQPAPLIGDMLDLAQKYRAPVSSF